MRYFKLLGLLLIALYCFGCVNNSIIYQSENIPIKPTKVGYSQFSQEELNKFKGKRSIWAYDSTMTTLLTEHKIACAKVYIPDFRELKEVSPDYIRRLCAKNNFDGLIVTQLKLEAVHNANHDSPHMYIGTTMESDIEMQYFNNEGELIIHTQGVCEISQGYGMDEKTYNSVSVATEGALSKLLKRYDDDE